HRENINGLTHIKTGESDIQGAFPCQQTNYHGSENFFTKLKHLMASITPSLMPRPLSLIPPNGLFSMRKPGTSLIFTLPQRSRLMAVIARSRFRVTTPELNP